MTPEGLCTLKYRQSSDCEAGCTRLTRRAATLVPFELIDGRSVAEAGDDPALVDALNWGQYDGVAVAMRDPNVVVMAAGCRRRRSFTGGRAYGIPRNFSTPPDEVPTTVPFLIVTVGCRTLGRPAAMAMDTAAAYVTAVNKICGMVGDTYPRG